MRHWFLHVTPLLAALLGVWTPLSFATQTLRNRIDPVVGIVSQPQQQSGPQALSPFPTYRRASPSVFPGTIGKRDGIFIQELASNYLLHYSVFNASISHKIRRPNNTRLFQKKSRAD